MYLLGSKVIIENLFISLRVFMSVVDKPNYLLNTLKGSIIVLRLN